MAKRYTRAELEYLRASPLVAKPTSLPPTEEWMGPLLDPNQKKVQNRGKNDETQVPFDGISRKMFERQVTRDFSNLPEDIILGPPKTAFASAAGVRHQNKTLDASSRPSFGAQGDDTARGERQNFRDKYAKQAQRYDADVEGAQEARPGNLQHRRLTNDGESWSNRQSRFSGQDDADRVPRRNGYREQDRDREQTTEPRTPRGFDNHRRDVNEANDTRRNGHGRGRNEPSWYRDDKDGEITENRRDATRTREWRDNRGSKEATLDGNRNAKQELDPEWMDEPDVQEKKQAHTQEDFERWKERMKAGNGHPTQENAPPPTGDQLKGHERTISGITSPTGKAKAETPLVVDSSIDGFFGLWNDPGKKATAADEQQTRPDTAKVKTAKSSKFTGFFGAKAFPTEQEVESPAPNPFAAPADSSSEDKEGFQRILKLLDQQQTNPAKDGAAREQAYRRNMPSSPGAQVQHRDTSNVQSLLSPQANSQGPPPPNKDSQFLLNLMRQPRPQLGHTASDDLRPNNSIPPELLPFQNLLVSAPPGLPNSIARSEEAKPLDKLNPTLVPERKIPPPGLFDPASRPGPHDSQRMGKEGPEFAPSYLSQHPPPRHSSMLPPPGFLGQMRNPSHFPPGLVGSMHAAPMFGGPERGNAHAMRGNMHPGMGPQGFMNGPPPPGLPPLQTPYFGGAMPRPPGDGFGEVGDFGGLGHGPFGRRQD